MIQLIKTEWLKIKKYSAFWWVIGLTALAYPGINYIFYSIYHSMFNNQNTASKLIKAAVGNPYSFPEVWVTSAFCSSLFVFIPAVVIIMFISNEYTFRTHRQNIIDGWSRNQFITSKLIDVFIVSALLTVLYFIFCLVLGAITFDDGSGDYFNKSYYSGLFFLQTFAQLSIAFMIGFLLRKAFIALAVFIFYYVLFENILIGVFKYFNADAVNQFLPLEISDRLIPPPAFLAKLDTPEKYEAAINNIPVHIGLTLVLTAIIWMICYRVNNRKDLK